MAYVEPGTGVVRCYNSQASGFQRTLPPLVTLRLIISSWEPTTLTSAFPLPIASFLPTLLLTTDTSSGIAFVNGTKVRIVVLYRCCSSIGQPTDSPFFIFVF